MKKLLAIGVIAFAGLGIVVLRGERTAKAQSTGRDILPLQLEEEMPVHGVAGRLGNFTADVKRKRLFVSALGNNTVEAIDTFAGRAIRAIKGPSQHQGSV